MSAILRQSVRRMEPLVKSSFVQKATVISGPPRVRVSFAEKATLGTVMIIGVVAPMGYVLANLKGYRERPEAE
ncbi:DgyrCDS12244 [Dimorphilus gyrociliatus]|uniref:DgyrCDS12244 n=1 Tax=Dimorphilus gyrociliatus TaxID=2664684 RepID=A0A7I8W6W6_9ANNE|nr:DgyrCDS12244 [Dimorphilus gyrociliatus]